MAEKYRTRALVFKKSERSEADRIFSVFTDDYGRLEVSGRAIRKINSKLRYGIDLFCLSEIEFIQGKNNKTLTDAIKIKKFGNISEDIKKTKIACQIAGVLDNFLKGQEKDKGVFDLLSEVFENLNSAKDHKLIYCYFIWNFLSLQGYRSEVNVCASCRRKLNPLSVYFSSRDGGVICKNCSAGSKDCHSINADVVKVLRIILKKEWQVLSKLKVEVSSKEILEDVSEIALMASCPA